MWLKYELVYNGLFLFRNRICCIHCDLFKWLDVKYSNTRMRLFISIQPSVSKDLLISDSDSWPWGHITCSSLNWIGPLLYTVLNLSQSTSTSLLWPWKIYFKQLLTCCIFWMKSCFFKLIQAMRSSFLPLTQKLHKHLLKEGETSVGHWGCYVVVV